MTRVPARVPASEGRVAMHRTQIWRWVFFFAGQLILSLGITMTIKGERLGIGPWDVLHVGLFRNFGLTIGSWSIITGLLIVSGTAVVLRKWPQIGTWLNMLLIGLFIDFFYWLLPDIGSLAGQTGMFIAGTAIMAVGIGMYVSPNIGAGPRDTLMLIITDRTGWSVKRVRTGLEVTVAIAGWALGGPVGVGTVVIALFLGQLVHHSIPWFRTLLLRVCRGDETALGGTPAK